jgi:hypothetical protein
MDVYDERVCLAVSDQQSWDVDAESPDGEDGDGVALLEILYVQLRL